MKNRNILVQLSELKKEQLIHDIFNFGAFNSGIGPSTKGKVPNCMTSGCLAGELPGITSDWYFDSEGNLMLKDFDSSDTSDRLEFYFGLSEDQIEHIFYNSLSNDLSVDSKLEQVQENLKDWLNENP